MGVQKFIVEEGTHQVGNSVGWHYTATHELLEFKSSFKEITVQGDYIGKRVMFICRGELSKFAGEMIKPKDIRAIILWRNGFESTTRVTDEELVDAGGEWINVVDDKSDYKDIDHNNSPIKTIIIRSEDGKIQIATARGRTPINHTFINISYMAKSATIEDAMRWEMIFLSKGVL